MANKGIKGITIEIGGDTKGLNKALEGVNKQSKDLQGELKEVERGLKFDPGNIELIRQKQELLTASISSTSEKLDVLRTAQSQVQAQFDRGDIGVEQYRAFQRELQTTEGELNRLENQLGSIGSEQARLSQTTRQLGTFFEATGTDVEHFSGTLGTRLTQAIRDGSANADQMERALRLMGRQALGASVDIDQMREALRNADNGANLDEIRLDLDRLSRSANEAEEEVEDLGEALNNAGEKMKDVGSSMTTGVSAPIAGIGIAAGLSAKQFDDAAAQIQASLGLTADEAEGLEAIAKSVWKNGFGESLEEVTDALVRVKQNIKGISDEAELERVTESAIALAKTFDSDVNEVTRAGNNLMTNFGIDSEKAFDMMANAAQNGLNFSNELFDNLAEYAPLWAAMGYSAEDMFGILQRGSKEGVYNLDYLNDIMKEFQIRIKDNSKSTSDAMGVMSQSTLDLWEAQYQGKATVADVAQSVIKDLKSMENQVDANEIGVALFGTKWEDLESKAVYAMLGSTESMKDFEGAMQGIVEVQEQTFGQRWESMTRNAATSLEPLGMILLDLAEQWLPKIIETVQALATWFAGLSPLIQILVVAFGAVIAALGPLLVVIGSVVTTLSTLIPLFATGGAGATAFGAVMAALTGPIAIAVAAIAGIIAVLVLAYNKIEWFRDGVNAIWDYIKEYTSQAFTAVKNLISSLISSGVDFAKGILDKFKAFWDENGKAILGLVKLYFGQIKSNIEMIMGIIKGIFQVVWPIISNLIKVVWEAIQLTIENTLDIILGIIQTVMKLIQGDWKGAWESIKKIGENIMGNIVKFFKDIDLAQIGKDIINGLVNGIGSMVGAVKKKVEELASNIPEWAKKILGIHSPSRVMAQIGVWTGEGLAKGLSSTQATVKKSMQDIGYVMIDIMDHYKSETIKIEKAASDEIAQINKRTNEDIAKVQNAAYTKKRKTTAAENIKIQRLQEDAAKKIAGIEKKTATDSVKLLESANKEMLDEVKLFIQDKKSLNQLSLVEEAAIWSESSKLFEDGTKEKLEAQKGYKAAVDAINKEILSINSNYQSKMQKINDDLKKGVEDLTKSYEDAFNNRWQSLLNFAGLFDEFKTEVTTTGDQLLSNLQGQVDGFKSWQSELDKLSTRPISEELLSELSKMGPKALPELLALNTLADDQLSTYSNLFAEKSALAREQASEELAGMKADTEQRIKEMREGADSQLAVLEKEWLSSIQSITKTTDTELSTLKQVGVNAGQGLLNGLSSMEAPLIAKATQIANAVSSAIQAALDIHSPSRVMRGFGINIGQGLIVGMDDMINKVAQSSRRLSDAVANAQGSLANSSMKAQGYSAPSSSSATTVDNSRMFAPVVHITTTDSGDKAMDRALRRLAFQFN